MPENSVIEYTRDLGNTNFHTRLSYRQFYTKPIEKFKNLPDRDMRTIEKGIFSDGLFVFAFPASPCHSIRTTFVKNESARNSTISTSIFVTKKVPLHAKIDRIVFEGD